MDLIEFRIHLLVELVQKKLVQFVVEGSDKIVSPPHVQVSSMVSSRRPGSNKSTSVSLKLSFSREDGLEYYDNEHLPDCRISPTITSTKFRS